MQHLESILQVFVGDQQGPGDGGKLPRKDGVVKTFRRRLHCTGICEARDA